MDYLRRALDWLNIHMTKAIALTSASIVSVYLLWDWFNVERIKAIAAVVQSFGFVVAAFLTYRYTMKLESHKFEMRLHEIAHANTHKRRMESLEKISNLMGTVLFKLSTVPPFIPELDPVPPLDKVADPQENEFQYRFRIKTERFNESLINLSEAVEQGLIYIDDSNYELLEKFKRDSVDLINNYMEVNSSRKTFAEFMTKFKQGLQVLRELRKNIIMDFKKQLQNLPSGR